MQVRTTPVSAPVGIGDDPLIGAYEADELGLRTRLSAAHAAPLRNVLV
jgi:hypothetical protein